MICAGALTRWVDPSLSGLVLGSGLVLLLSLSYYSALSVAAYFSLSLVLLGLGSKLYVHLMGLLKKPCKDPLLAVENMDVSLTEEQVSAVLLQATECYNLLATKLKSLLLVENALDSLKFSLVLYISTLLGSLANTLTLATLAWLAAFSLPSLYTAKQKELDSLLATLQGHYTAANSKLVALFPAPAQEVKQE